MKSTYSFVRSAIAVAVVAGVAAGSAALALPAFAADNVVTGYETGYSYHQGLANGSGAALMSANDASSQSSTVTTNTAAPASTGVSSAPTQTTELPANANAAVVPATQPAQQVAAAPAALSFAAMLAGLPVTTWAAIGLILLALILALLVLLTPRETVTRTTRTYQYR